MTIPVSTIADVSISIGAKFPQRAGFGTANLVTAETGVIGIAERIRKYNNLDGVAVDWGADTEVVKAATAYFAQQPKPTVFKVSTRYPDAQAAQLRGGAVVDNAENLAAFKAIANGEFSITINSTTESINALNFTSVTSLVDVATALQLRFTNIGSAISDDAFRNTKVTYRDSRFYFDTGIAGDSATVSFLTILAGTSGVDISSLLQMQQGQGTKVSGIAAETITASLNAINEIDEDWYGLLFTKEVRDDVVINGENAVQAAADWCEARIKVLGNTSNDLDVLDSVNESDIATVLKNKGLRRTMTTYSSYPVQYPSASIFGRAFTVNFNQPDSTLTLKFKQMPTITVENLSQSEKAVLDSKNANALITVGASVMYAESFMSSGIFFDEVHGLDWLQNAIQTNVFGYLLTRPAKVAYTNKGVAAIEQQVTRALDEAVRNGLIAPGKTIDGEFLATGYKVTVIPVEDINQSDVESRHYPGLSFVALGAAAIHSVQINGIFER